MALQVQVSSDTSTCNWTRNIYKISHSESRIACDKDEFLTFKMVDLIKVNRIMCEEEENKAK